MSKASCSATARAAVVLGRRGGGGGPRSRRGPGGGGGSRCSGGGPGRRRPRSRPRRPPSPCTAVPPKLRRSGRRATAAPYQIRPAAAPDLPAIHAIEEVAFSDPWSVKDFRECLAAGMPFLVAVAGGDVAGYAIAHVAADEGEILNLGV